MSSKTVIVFSTRLICPEDKNGLFSDAKPEPFKSKKLADYFWNRIKKDDSLLKTILADDYFVNPKKIELVDFLSTHETELKKAIRDIDPKLPFSITEFEWIEDLFSSAKPFSLHDELTDKYDAFNKSKTDFDTIKKTKSIDLCKNLQNSSNQVPYDLDPDRPRENGPWLYYRCCFYKLNNKNNKDISVYAVWPLKTNSPQLRDGKYQWVEALTDQFLDQLNPGAEELFLILHDNDIEDHTPFKVIIDDKHGNTARHVALFQHQNNDEIGHFLKKTPKNSSLKDVKSYVEQEIMVARIRKWLCDAYDYITNDDINKLWNASAKLIRLDENKFKFLYEIVDIIEGGTPTATKQHLDELKLSLINILNQGLREYMIIKKS